MTTTLGIFRTHSEATDAVGAIQARGVAPEEISYVQRVVEQKVPVEIKEGTGTGTAVGAVAGLALTFLALPAYPLIVAGPAATALGLVGGTLVGAAAGGLIGALTDIGFTPEEAEAVERYVEEGNVIVTVRDETSHEDLMREHSAMEVYVTQ